MGLGTIVADQRPQQIPKLYAGLCVGIDWSTLTASINIGGGVVPAQIANTVPRIGKTVWVLVTETAALCVGKPSLPALGTVSGTPASGFVNVTLDGTSEVISLPYEQGTTPASGWRVLLNWDAGGHIVMRISGEVGQPFYEQPAPPPVPGGGGSGPQQKEQIFYPTDSASARGGSWVTQDVIQGDSYSAGAFFYGNQMAGTIPASATIVSVEFNAIVLESYGNANAFLGRHNSQFRAGTFTPADIRTLGNPLNGGFSGWVDITSFGWGDLFKAGGGEYGIALSGLGFRQLAGVNRPGSGGAMRIRWKE